MGKEVWLILLIFGECLQCARPCWQEPKEKDKDPVFKDLSLLVDLDK